MPKGVPKAGFRKTGKHKSQTLQELEQAIAEKAPGFVEELEKYVKPFPCPHCGNEIQVIDKEVAMYMVDRALGKPKLKHEVDITEQMQFNADDIEKIIDRHPVLSKIRDLVGLIANYPEDKVIQILTRAYEIAQRELLPEATIEGEYSVATPENTGTNTE